MEKKINPVNQPVCWLAIGLAVMAALVVMATPGILAPVRASASLTISEIDNLGFNLYRTESLRGPMVRLSGALIPSRSLGNAVGAVYQ